MDLINSDQIRVLTVGSSCEGCGHTFDGYYWQPHTVTDYLAHLAQRVAALETAHETKDGDA